MIKHDFNMNKIIKYMTLEFLDFVSISKFIKIHKPIILTK